MIDKHVKQLKISNLKLLWLSLLLLGMVVEAVYLMKDQQTVRIEASEASQVEVTELHVTP